MATQATPVETSKAYSIERLVTVNKETTTLPVKIVHKPEKNTVKITASVTTKQIHLSNVEINEATVKQLSIQILEAIKFSQNLILEGASSSDDSIPFPEEGTED